MTTHTSQRPRARNALTLTAISLIVTLAACARPAAQATTASRIHAHIATHSAAMPSNKTRMICSPEAQRELRATLGVSPIEPVVASWHHGRYACEYRYANSASFSLGVQQFADDATARRYFDAITRQLGRRTTLQGLGQHATTTRAGAVVVQKDNDVLIVDPANLPPRFGNPPDTPTNGAISIAATIIGCWTER